MSRCRFLRTQGIEITRTEFSPDDYPALLIGLTLHNTHAEPQQVCIQMEVRSELLASYPWDWSSPENTRQVNHDDEALVENGRLIFHEPDHPWYAVVGTGNALIGIPFAGQVGDNFWGPVPERERRNYTRHGHGAGGRTGVCLRIRGSDTVVAWFAVTGSHIGLNAAQETMDEVLSDPARLLAEKIEIAASAAGAESGDFA